MVRIDDDTKNIVKVLVDADEGTMLEALAGDRNKRQLFDDDAFLKFSAKCWEEPVPESKKGQLVRQLVSEIENQIALTGSTMLKVKFELMGEERDKERLTDALQKAILAYKQATLEITILNAAAKKYECEPFLTGFVKTRKFDTRYPDSVLDAVSDFVNLTRQFRDYKQGR